MSVPLTIQLGRPIRSARPATYRPGEPEGAPGVMSPIQQRLVEVEQQQRHLTQTCQVLDDLAGKLSRFYEDMVTTHRREIARLAVEIARKVLMQKVQQGDYDVEAIIQEALEKAPARQGVTVHVSPQDWETCQRLQQERPDSPWACMTFVADPSLGQAQCLVETPRGVVKSFIEEHLEKIQEALEKAG